MLRMRPPVVIAAGLAGLLISCTASPRRTSSPHPRSSTSPSAHAAPPPPSPVASELFVVAEGFDGYADHGVRLELCDVTGAVFLCPLGLIYRNDEFGNAGLGQLFSVVGDWPNNLWALRFADCVRRADYEPTPACPFGLEASRWSEETWNKQRFIKLERGRDILHSIRAWPRGRALLFDNRLVPSRRGDPTIAYHVDVVGPQPHPPLGQRKRLGDPDFYFNVQMAGPDEALVTRFKTLPNEAGPTELVERWVSDKRVATTAVPEGHSVMAVDWFHMLAAPSSSSDGSSRALARYFDGSSWTTFELPQWGREVLSYAREPDATEWIVVSDGRVNYLKAPIESRAYRRKPGSSWKQVLLPPPLIPGLSGDRDIKPISVHAFGAGDVWIRGWTVGDCFRTTLLHTKRAKSVCYLDQDSTACGAKPAARPRTGSACPGLLSQ